MSSITKKFTYLYTLRLIDIGSLIKDRKFVIIEQHLNDILDCVFESEFDVRILDEGVLKIFRLAQLAVEYQQFCRHYLDRSVYVLREEITSLAQELDISKKNIREKDEEIRRLRKRSRHAFKNPLPYGNDNIATMILKTLSQKNELMFPTQSNDSLMQYNKCNHCDKVFLNQLYLKSHISRRHPHITESPQKDIQTNILNNENSKLSLEVSELKNKIKEMEIIIANSNKITDNSELKETKTAPTEKDTTKNDKQNNIKLMKDAEVSTNMEEYLINKIEEWKKQEHDDYSKEMNKLRNQLMETINIIKEKENHTTIQTEPDVVTQLQETIKQQGIEIITLKKELNDSKVKTEKNNAERNKEAEAQILFWTNRAEAQSKQYEQLLQKLNDVAKDARESRSLVEAEKERAAQLKALLQQNLASKRNENTDDVLTQSPNRKSNNVRPRKNITKHQTNSNRSEQELDDNSLMKLHRKAQELLNLASITSSSSSSEDSSSESYRQANAKVAKYDKSNQLLEATKTTNVIANKMKYEEKPQIVQNSLPHKSTKAVNGKLPKFKKQKPKTNHIKSDKSFKKSNGLHIIPPSPIKLVRSKITEEVNNRLATAGVDPLKSRLPQNVFQKQKMRLHELQELKTKTNPAHDKARHTILAFLDTNTPEVKNDLKHIPDYISPTKRQKPFKNLTSVISNVKTKALSLVKLNDSNIKEKKRSQNAEVAKRAMSLLKTPPGSTSNSPTATKRSPLKGLGIIQKYLHATDYKDEDMKTAKNKSSPPKSMQPSLHLSNSDEISEESDHKYYNSTTLPMSTKSVESLIKSPARRPASATEDYKHVVQKYTISDDNLVRTQSATNLQERLSNADDIFNKQTLKQSPNKINDNSSDDVESLIDIPTKKIFLDNNIQNSVKQTKSVLKNASSTSSLNKKKVLFDMDAIQMKSVSASPSQSITEKSDGNEKYELGLVNLDAEEWDISSIENEPLKNDTKIQNMTRTSPKIAELKEKIESQLARRSDTSVTALVGGVDVLAGTMLKASSIGGSNTSLGSSILDDSESVPVANKPTIVKPKKVAAKEDSDIDISEFSVDGILNKNESF